MADVGGGTCCYGGVTDHRTTLPHFPVGYFTVVLVVICWSVPTPADVDLLGGCLTLPPLLRLCFLPTLPCLVLTLPLPDFTWPVITFLAVALPCLTSPLYALPCLT